MPPSGGIGTVRVTASSGARRVAKSATPVPVPSSVPDLQALTGRLRRAHLELPAWPGAVACARHHARQLLLGWGRTDLIESVELVVSELVTNAVRASGGLDSTMPATGEPLPVVRLWLTVEQHDVLVLVWDADPGLPQRREPRPDDDSGRGLLLVELISAVWGSFEFADEPGKVVWALCRS